MFEFEFDEALFALNWKRPAFEALFQLPPTMRIRQPVFELTAGIESTSAAQTIPTRIIRLFSRLCCDCKKITKTVIFKFYKTGGFAPCTPVIVSLSRKRVLCGSSGGCGPRTPVRGQQGVARRRPSSSTTRRCTRRIGKDPHTRHCSSGRPQRGYASRGSS